MPLITIAVIKIRITEKVKICVITLNINLSGSSENRISLPPIEEYMTPTFTQCIVIIRQIRIAISIGAKNTIFTQPGNILELLSTPICFSSQKTSTSKEIKAAQKRYTFLIFIKPG